MKRIRTWLLTTCFTLLLVATAALLAPAAGANAAEESENDTAPAALDGAKVYAWNCGACHSERYPRERTDAEWEVIVTHMRVRANLTAAQSEAVVRYLKANNE